MHMMQRGTYRYDIYYIQIMIYTDHDAYYLGVALRVTLATIITTPF